jgi:hypothetical protein
MDLTEPETRISATSEIKDFHDKYKVIEDYVAIPEKPKQLKFIYAKHYSCNYCQKIFTNKQYRREHTVKFHKFALPCKGEPKVKPDI